MIEFETGYSQYTGTGSRQLFEYGFTVLEDSLVKVLVDGSVPVYTQQSNGVVITPAPILNAVVELFRYTDVTQLTDWVPFDSFNAEWTEDACDKLIMLKQEAWFRTKMNLASEHLLDRVILHNDKGTDAHLLIWNEVDPPSDIIVNEAGVFAGEVTDDMPEPGTFVLKPDDFAYFQWGTVSSRLTLTTTSTLYPEEADEGLGFGIELSGGAIYSWPEDALDPSFSLTSIEMTLILIDDGTTEDALDPSFSLTSAEMTLILLDDGTTEDALDPSFELISIEMTPLLVSALTQDEGLSFGAELIGGTLETPLVNVVHDSFTDTNFTAINAHTPDLDTVGSGWVIYDATGNPIIVNNRLVGAAGNAMCGIDSGQANAEVYCDIVFPGAGAMEGGVTGRITDNNNYWYCDIPDSTLTDPVLRIMEMVAGTPTLRDSVTMTGLGPMQSQTHTVKMTFSGDDITATIGAFTASYNSATGNAQTVHGCHFQNAQAQHDNFYIDA